MSIVDQLACMQNRRDEVPNQELARQLAETANREAIGELVGHLGDKNRDIRHDCIKVLYEIGYIHPDLIAEHVVAFLKLIKSRDNRMVWGGMITLATIAATQSEEIFTHYGALQQAMETGSVITIDNGVKVLAQVAAAKAEYNAVIFPDLLQHLKVCRDKEVPQHAESTLPAVNTENKQAFVEMLERRMADLSASQAARIKKVIKEAQKR